MKNNLGMNIDIEVGNFGVFPARLLNFSTISRQQKRQMYAHKRCNNRLRIPPPVWEELHEESDAVTMQSGTYFKFAQNGQHESGDTTWSSYTSGLSSDSTSRCPEFASIPNMSGRDSFGNYPLYDDSPYMRHHSKKSPTESKRSSTFSTFEEVESLDFDRPRISSMDSSVSSSIFSRGSRGDRESHAYGDVESDLSSDSSMRSHSGSKKPNHGPEIEGDYSFKPSSSRLKNIKENNVFAHVAINSLMSGVGGANDTTSQRSTDSSISSMYQSLSSASQKSSPSESSPRDNERTFSHFNGFPANAYGFMQPAMMAPSQPIMTSPMMSPPMMTSPMTPPMMGLGSGHVMAEEQLIGLGFSGGSNSFLPQRFLADWQNKITHAHLQSMYYVQQMQQRVAYHAAYKNPALRQTRIPSRPKQTRFNAASEFLRKLDFNSRTTAEARKGPLQRSASSLHASALNTAFDSMESSSTNSTDFDVAAQKQDSFDNLKSILERQAKIFSRGRRTRAKMNLSDRQNSLPLNLETLSEEDDVRSTNSTGSLKKIREESIRDKTPPLCDRLESAATESAIITQGTNTALNIGTRKKSLPGDGLEIKLDGTRPDIDVNFDSGDNLDKSNESGDSSGNSDSEFRKPSKSFSAFRSTSCSYNFRPKSKSFTSIRSNVLEKLRARALEKHRLNSASNNDERSRPQLRSLTSSSENIESSEASSYYPATSFDMASSEVDDVVFKSYESGDQHHFHSLEKNSQKMSNDSRKQSASVDRKKTSSNRKHSRLERKRTNSDSSFNTAWESSVEDKNDVDGDCDVTHNGTYKEETNKDGCLTKNSGTVAYRKQSSASLEVAAILQEKTNRNQKGLSLSLVKNDDSNKYRANQLKKPAILVNNEDSSDNEDYVIKTATSHTKSPRGQPIKSPDTATNQRRRSHSDLEYWDDHLRAPSPNWSTFSGSSPVTVIEVELDNQGDISDSDTTSPTKTAGSLLSAVADSLQTISEVSDEQTIIPEVGDICGIESPDSPRSKVECWSRSCEADDGNLSPILSFDPVLQNFEKSSAKPEVSENQGQPGSQLDQTSQVDLTPLSPLLPSCPQMCPGTESSFPKMLDSTSLLSMYYMAKDTGIQCTILGGEASVNSTQTFVDSRSICCQTGEVHSATQNIDLQGKIADFLFAVFGKLCSNCQSNCASDFIQFKIHDDTPGEISFISGTERDFATFEHTNMNRNCYDGNLENRRSSSIHKDNFSMRSTNNYEANNGGTTARLNVTSRKPDWGRWSSAPENSLPISRTTGPHKKYFSQDSKCEPGSFDNWKHPVHVRRVFRDRNETASTIELKELFDSCDATSQGDLTTYEPYHSKRRRPNEENLSGAEMLNIFGRGSDDESSHMATEFDATMNHVITDSDDVISHDVELSDDVMNDINTESDNEIEDEVFNDSQHSVSMNNYLQQTKFHKNISAKSYDYARIMAYKYGSLDVNMGESIHFTPLASEEESNSENSDYTSTEKTNSRCENSAASTKTTEKTSVSETESDFSMGTQENVQIEALINSGIAQTCHTKIGKKRKGEKKLRSKQCETTDVPQVHVSGANDPNERSSDNTRNTLRSRAFIPHALTPMNSVEHVDYNQALLSTFDAFPVPLSPISEVNSDESELRNISSPRTRNASFRDFEELSKQSNQSDKSGVTIVGQIAEANLNREDGLNFNQSESSVRRGGLNSNQSESSVSSVDDVQTASERLSSTGSMDVHTGRTGSTCDVTSGKANINFNRRQSLEKVNVWLGAESSNMRSGPPALRAESPNQRPGWGDEILLSMAQHSRRWKHYFEEMDRIHRSTIEDETLQDLNVDFPSLDTEPNLQQVASLNGNFHSNGCHGQQSLNGNFHSNGYQMEPSVEATPGVESIASQNVESNPQNQNSSWNSFDSNGTSSFDLENLLLRIDKIDAMIKAVTNSYDKTSQCFDRVSALLNNSGSNMVGLNTNSGLVYDVIGYENDVTNADMSMNLAERNQSNNDVTTCDDVMSSSRDSSSQPPRQAVMQAERDLGVGEMRFGISLVNKHSLSNVFGNSLDSKRTLSDESRSTAITSFDSCDNERSMKSFEKRPLKLKQTKRFETSSLNEEELKRILSDMTKQVQNENKGTRGSQLRGFDGNPETNQQTLQTLLNVHDAVQEKGTNVRKSWAKTPANSVDEFGLKLRSLKESLDSSDSQNSEVIKTLSFVLKLDNALERLEDKVQDAMLDSEDSLTEILAERKPEATYASNSVREPRATIAKNHAVLQPEKTLANNHAILDPEKMFQSNLIPQKKSSRVFCKTPVNSVDFTHLEKSSQQSTAMSIEAKIAAQNVKFDSTITKRRSNNRGQRSRIKTRFPLPRVPQNSIDLSSVALPEVTQHDRDLQLLLNSNRGIVASNLSDILERNGMKTTRERAGSNLKTSALAEGDLLPLESPSLKSKLFFQKSPDESMDYEYFNKQMDSSDSPSVSEANFPNRSEEMRSNFAKTPANSFDVTSFNVIDPFQQSNDRLERIVEQDSVQTSEFDQATFEFSSFDQTNSNSAETTFDQSRTFDQTNSTQTTFEQTTFDEASLRSFDDGSEISLPSNETRFASTLSKILQTNVRDNTNCVSMETESEVTSIHEQFRFEQNNQQSIESKWDSFRKSFESANSAFRSFERHEEQNSVSNSERKDFENSPRLRDSYEPMEETTLPDLIERLPTIAEQQSQKPDTDFAPKVDHCSAIERYWTDAIDNDLENSDKTILKEAARNKNRGAADYQNLDSNPSPKDTSENNKVSSDRNMDTKISSRKTESLGSVRKFDKMAAGNKLTIKIDSDVTQGQDYFVTMASDRSPSCELITIPVPNFPKVIPAEEVATGAEKSKTDAQKSSNEAQKLKTGAQKYDEVNPHGYLNYTESYGCYGETECEYCHGNSENECSHDYTRRRNTFGGHSKSNTRVQVFLKESSKSVDYNLMTARKRRERFLKSSLHGTLKYT